MASGSSARESGPSGADKTCVLCCQELEIFAVGKCDHPVCYRCSTKMRALCGQRYCAVCRLELDKVVFMKKVVPFSTIVTHQFHHEKKFDIYIADGRIHAHFRKLLQHDCPVCSESRPFNTFEDLEHHMRKQHEMFSCKLCVRHLQIFTYERKWYNRKDLARHRMHGDPDDTSHRGHPLCKFCDDRYLDNDELLKHLRRDHYFCHFCDSDGAQEYYSDYDYLRDHFREKHYLCEEGRCNTEQFTHAFRSEIDYKAHKATFHSKNRAEARQNRQIDLQFNYIPRHPRRNEGMVSGDDYEEVDRLNRRGGQNRGQNRRGRWKYTREEEDRDVAAAVRASIAAQRQEEKKQAALKKETDDSKNNQSEREMDETCNVKNVVRTSNEISGTKEAIKGSSKQENLQTVPTTAVSNPSSNHLVPVGLNEDEFPSLSATAHVSTTGLTPTYTSAAKKNTTFQEEDFPALVSKIKQQKPSTATSGSAWITASGKSSFKTAHSSGNSSNQTVKKSLSTHGAKAKTKPALKSDNEEEDDGSGLTTQEFRSAPTMLDISSLLTTSAQTVCKVGKKKKIGGEKQNSFSALGNDTVINKAQKENVPEIKQSAPVSSVLNGHIDKLCPESASLCTLKEPPGFKKIDDDPGPLPEEDFPALGNAAITKMPPPPGFNNLLPMKSPPSNLPPPPGLTAPVSKPPPGFTGVPLNSNISEPMIPAPKQSSNIYLLPENFKQRNVELIQSINTILHNDETKFNKFKTQSGQFRQGRISAADYYRSCRELLGENFLKIFNELLVLLPDTAKQQELLSAHKDLREKQGSNKSKKNKKNAWQTTMNSDSDYQVCPTCQQVLTQKDFATHKASHFEEDEFPTLQSVSRIIS